MGPIGLVGGGSAAFRRRENFNACRTLLQLFHDGTEDKPNPKT
jgi:hypothetical protein